MEERIAVEKSAMAKAADARAAIARAAVSVTESSLFAAEVEAEAAEAEAVSKRAWETAQVLPGLQIIWFNIPLYACTKFCMAYIEYQTKIFRQYLVSINTGLNSTKIKLFCLGFFQFDKSYYKK